VDKSLHLNCIVPTQVGIDLKSPPPGKQVPVPAAEIAPRLDSSEPGCRGPFAQRSVLVDSRLESQQAILAKKPRRTFDNPGQRFGAGWTRR
jgi:hypothetical protein